MPVMDGLGFLIEKPRRNLAEGVPVVMITADATDPHLLRAVAAGAQGYISKPFTIEQIHASVVSVMHASTCAAPVLPSPGSIDKTIGGAP
jgi:two-component system, chemotaxis family, chemotaxis protein CheY